MEIETTTKIKEKVIKLSDIKNLKMAKLKCSYGEDNFDFLSDDLTEQLKQKLEDRGFKHDGLKVYYDLSYSQGDFFNFEGLITTKEAEFRVKSNEPFDFNVDLVKLFINHKKVKNNQEVYYDDMTEKQREKADDILFDFQETCRIINYEMKKLGYETIQTQEKDNILREAFREFLQLNNIKEDEIFNYSYSETAKKGYVQIAENGDTIMKGLWLKDLKIKRVYKTITYKPIIEETSEFI